MQVFNKTGSLTSTICLIFDSGCYYQFVAISESNNTFSEEIKVIPNSGEYSIYNSVALLCNTTNQKCNYNGLSIEIKASQCYTSGLSVQISGYQSSFSTCLVSVGDGTYRQNMLANHVSETDFISVCKTNPVVSSASKTVSFWW
jgi:hypothetical protein